MCCYRFRAVYECDEFPGFIRECISLFEKMKPERVEETLMGFIRKYATLACMNNL